MHKKKSDEKKQKNGRQTRAGMVAWSNRVGCSRLSLKIWSRFSRDASKKKRDQLACDHREGKGKKKKGLEKVKVTFLVDFEYETVTDWPGLRSLYGIEFT